MGSLIVAGIDVGAPKKGFHAMALKDGTFLSKLTSCDHKEILEWCNNNHVCTIGIDAPCTWRTLNQARSCEKKLQAAKIGCFWTPTREAAERHPENFYGWMFNGEKLYAALRKTYSLYTGQSNKSSNMMFETFPHAIACSLAGKVLKAKNKIIDRRKLLEQCKISIENLSNIDWVDAGLCAYTAHCFASNLEIEPCGDRETGLMIVPKNDLISRKRD